MPLQHLSLEEVLAAVEVLGTPGISEDDIESRIFEIAKADEMSARRLIDCIPEAFGLVLAVRLSETHALTLPTTFSAKDEAGTLHRFAFDVEPIFPAALRIAVHMFEDGPRAKVEAITNRSSIYSAINNALNAGGSLEGARLSGPELRGIPAELYRDRVA